MTELAALLADDRVNFVQLQKFDHGHKLGVAVELKPSSRGKVYRNAVRVQDFDIEHAATILRTWMADVPA